MSHASLLAAIDAVNPKDRAEIEAAVAFQMEPYSENEEWFRNGSRWDWYVIGGRFAGRLVPDYDPAKDPRNLETCSLCGGCGIRRGGLEQFGRGWFDACNGCNGCNGSGIARKFSNADFEGDIVQVKLLPKGCPVPAFRAFLRDRHWHESERLGWFGGTAATECELKASDDPDVVFNRCLTIGDENARIVTWQEPWEIWQERFHKRFIEPLLPESVLVVVDYHV